MKANTNTKGKLSVHKYSFNCSILFLFKCYIFLNQRCKNKHRLRRNPAQPIKKGYSLHFLLFGLNTIYSSSSATSLPLMSFSIFDT
jgi:hypothetical protein